MPPLRVLFLTDRFPPQRGGVAASAFRQAAALAPECERLDVLLLDGTVSAGRVESSESGALTVHRVGRADSDDETLGLLFRIGGALVDRHRPTVIHGFFAVPAGDVAALLGRERGIPSVVSLRGNDVDRALFHGPRLPMLERAMRNAGLVAGVSREILRRAELAGADSAKLRYLPNGVDVGTFAPGPPGGSPLAPLPAPRVLFSGEARWKKGLPLLLELAELFAARGAGTVALAGGVRADGREGFERWRRSEPRAAARLVELPWSRDPSVLAATYRDADLVVLPSLADGCPNALLEAMACGRPVLASAVGGIPDVVEDGVSGFLLPFADLGRFSREADRVLATGAERLAKIGAAARERILGGFTLADERSAVLALHREAAALDRDSAPLRHEGAPPREPEP